jgi:hypothetical protein
VPCSNGEFVPPAPSEVVVEAARRTLAGANERARRLGMDRRTFLRSSLGTATTLAALAACTEESGQGSAGTFTVPEEATTDTTAAETTLGPSTTAPDEQPEVVVDVQTHFLEGGTLGFGGGFPQAGCGDDPSLCFTIDVWADLVLGSSDTSVAVLSALPIVADDHPMSIEKMETARRLAEALCGEGRVLLQGEAFPQVGELGETLDRMSQLASEHALVAWKTYTHTGGGYSFLDERGTAFLDHVSQLASDGVGPPVVCVHKGFGADPADIGPAAAAHPDLTFCVYHSGFEVSSGAPAGGVERFVRSLADAGVAPGSNVYGELGSTWHFALTDPDKAAHVLGELLLAVGPERILWGTDSVWYGSPQDQIEAFRAFEITPQAQEDLGYPALTPAIKRRVLGHNAAELHGIDLSTVAAACEFTPEDRAAAREEALGRLAPLGLAGVALGPMTRRQALTAWRREHPWFA